MTFAENMLISGRMQGVPEDMIWEGIVNQLMVIDDA